MLWHFSSSFLLLLLALNVVEENYPWMIWGKCAVAPAETELWLRVAQMRTCGLWPVCVLLLSLKQFLYPAFSWIWEQLAASLAHIFAFTCIVSFRTRSFPIQFGKHTWATVWESSNYICNIFFCKTHSLQFTIKKILYAWTFRICVDSQF